jgi:hypothetical protein
VVSLPSSRRESDASSRAFFAVSPRWMPCVTSAIRRSIRQRSASSESASA